MRKGSNEQNKYTHHSNKQQIRINVSIIIYDKLNQIRIKEKKKELLKVHKLGERFNDRGKKHKIINLFSDYFTCEWILFIWSCVNYTRFRFRRNDLTM